MNILLKSFDGDHFDKQFIERAFRNIPIETCIATVDRGELQRAFRSMTSAERGNLTDYTQILADVHAKEYIELPARSLRHGQYDFVDWNTITPLDEDLIEHMRHAEAMVMTMITKYAKTRDIPYRERKRQYYQHLRFWNHMLTTKKIDFVFMNHPPHQCYDYVIYGLCKKKGIPVLYNERILTVDAFFLVEDWEESALDFRDRLEELKREYADTAKPIHLSENYEYYFTYYRTKERLKPWYQLQRDDPAKHSFVGRWWKDGLRFLLTKPHVFFSSVLSGEFWSRKLRQHRTLRFYDQHAHAPDLSVPYIYVPLHLQPEASTIPQAGAFLDQDLIVELIAACLPLNIRIYVKEHPLQSERWRTETFYKDLLAIPSVSFVPKTADTFQLIDNSIAVASATGSAIFEAILRQKPTLMFGHFFYQYGPGVHPIRSLEDCKTAIRHILEQKSPHTERDIRLFLKAIDESAIPCNRHPDSPIEHYTQEEKTDLMGTYMEKRIRKMFHDLT